jgi:hypothetical protein
MDEEPIAIVDLADDLQVRKQRIFKILPRLGIRPAQRRDVERGNQNVATVTPQEATSIRAELARPRDASSDGTARSPGVGSSFLSDDVGYFYLIELEPAHDPGRFKVGFTTDLDGRLQKHRCSAPFARYVKTWQCRRAWEKTAIDCVTDGCERLHTEVFRSTLLESAVARADSFFTVMPKQLSDIGDVESESLDESLANSALQPTSPSLTLGPRS